MKTVQARRIPLFVVCVFLCSSLCAAQQTPADYLKQGNEQLDQKNFPEAIRLYGECIRLNPNAEGCFMNRALAHRLSKNFDPAIADYTEVIRLTPKAVAAYASRGYSQAQKGNFDLALADYDEAIKVDPNYAGTYSLRGTTYSQMRKLPLAIADYEMSLKLQPNNAAVKDALDAAHARHKFNQDMDTASGATAEALRLGNQKLGEKDWDAAISSFTTCLNASPFMIECRRNRAVARAAKKDYAGAIHDYTFVISFRPTADVYLSRGLAYREKGDLDLALNDFTSAIKLQPKNAELYMERGGTLIHKQEAKSAIADLDEAIKLNAQEPRYYFARGYAYEKAGNTTLATIDYKSALKIDPNFAAAKEQLQKLGVQP